MRIRVGCDLGFDFPQTIPMIVTLNVHFSRFSDLEHPDHLGQRFLGSNHIRRPRRACRTRCERRDGD
jgi:hypothetical protein